MKNLSIILVSPKGALNVGGVARLMGNFGVENLRMSEPRCVLDSQECKQMAMHSYDRIKNAKIYSSLAEAQSELELSIAFSARTVRDNRPAMDLRTFLEGPWQNCTHRQVGLVFGREETGLRLEELDRCDYQISIPTMIESTSLNLTTAVGIVLSEFYFAHCKLEGTQERAIDPNFERPSKMQEEIFFERIQNLLVDIRYANPQNPRHTLQDLRRLFHRADVSERDLRILFGILAGVEMTLERRGSLRVPSPDFTESKSTELDR